MSEKMQVNESGEDRGRPLEDYYDAEDPLLISRASIAARARQSGPKSGAPLS